MWLYVISHWARGTMTGPYVTKASISQQEPSLDEHAKVTCTTQITPHSPPIRVYSSFTSLSFIVIILKFIKLKPYQGNHYLINRIVIIPLIHDED